MEIKEKELNSIILFRENILKHPTQTDLLTLEDADEYKLPALNKLLNWMYKLNSELTSVGLKLTEDKDEKYPTKNIYTLTDAEYANVGTFSIRIESNWLNPEYRNIGISAGFSFFLYVIQDGYKGRGEVADWIRIVIKYFNTTPVCFASCREHVKCLGAFVKDPERFYFHDIPMEYRTSVSFNRLDDGMNFKTATFSKAVEDACTVMKKIIIRKEFLRPIEI